MAVTAFDSAAGEPGGVSIVVVVASFRSFRRRGPAEFAPPDDQGVFEKSAFLQIFDQGANAPVAGLRQPGMAIDNVFMASVPGDVVVVD